DGEKTCVALAAFLTELATATHRSALVFDDPVTSLDHRWRPQVARRLVEEATSRQIIVFTHDLIFVNDLVDLAERAHRPLQLVTASPGRPAPESSPKDCRGRAKAWRTASTSWKRLRPRRK